MDEIRRDEQLHTEPDLSVEDIVAEFGEPEDVKIWTPKASQPASEPVMPEPAAPEPVEPEPLHELLPPEPEPEPEPPEDAAGALRRMTQRRGLGRGGALLAWLLLLLTAAVTALRCNPDWGVSAYLPEAIGAIVPPAIFAAHVVLALPVLLAGVKTLPRRFSARTLLLLTAAAVCAAGIAGAGELWAAGSLLLTAALQSERLLHLAECRTLQLALAAQQPAAAVRDGRTVTRADGDAEALAADLLAPQERTLDIAAPLLAALTLAAAVVLSVRAGREFLWAWSVLLLGAYPLGGLAAYGRAFAHVAAKLTPLGAAVGGRRGAAKLSGDAAVVVTDGDLFPHANLSMNGIKVFGEETPDRLLGYAAALLEAADAGVARLFLEAAESQRTRLWHPDQFRVYDAGGLGGEIGGDVVLLGSREFLQTMRVPVPEDVKLPRALYIAVNGKAAGVFVLTYTPSDAVRSALAALLRSGARLILCTHDVLLTPAAVAAKYGVPPERMEFPVRRERDALLEAAQGEQGALLAKRGFVPFARAVAGARKLRAATRSATAIALLGAGLGLLLTALLTLTGAHEAASAWNLLLYHALWCIPMLLLT